MRTIAITNHKGGSGKTTTTVNLAAALAEVGRRILLIDLDPQASATTWCGIKDGGRGLLDVFTDNRSITPLITQTAITGLDIVASSAWLVGAEKALSGEVGAETILRRNLDRLPAKSWDYVLVDCAPSLGILTINALAGVREVLVPVEAHVMSLSGLAHLLQTVKVVQERLNPDLRISGIVACRVDARTRHAVEVVEELRRRFGSIVYNTSIRENIRIAECPSFGQPITQYDSKGRGAEDFRGLAIEIQKKRGGGNDDETKNHRRKSARRGRA
jgi:chromosome partitioning protein